ncbi:MAG TPA: response regulator [Chromatiaceae bacterium]|jgi:two-component system nitrate/nitrite response regulator NarL|nr:response regulator [Chromatiaceae bacterium]HIB85433.1 response regulator [Chromatiaceae bacterium]HIN82653.1 response regulator [Chromatiales bacterium]HIO13972.1 response regulator [Chromatiales bacterium]HIO54823.1 response regulator [Chromatiales bacterium]
MRILIIDDHALFRFGIEELLSRRSIEVVAAVGDGAEGVRIALQTVPDIILLDMRMPGMSGLEVLKALKEQGSEVPVAILTTSGDESDLVKALQAGARGYLLKDMEPDDLPRKLMEIVAGHTVVAPELAGVLARVVQGDAVVAQSTDQPNLTPREYEILGHVAAGQSNKVIARNLDISEGTVKLHVKSILRKLGVRSRVEAAVLAVENNWCGRSAT